VSIPEEFVISLQTASSAIADYLVTSAATAAPAGKTFISTCCYLRAWRKHSATIPCSILRYFPKNAGPRACAMQPFAFATWSGAVPEARFASAHSATLFSATLSPWQFYVDMLGTPPETPWMEYSHRFRQRNWRSRWCRKFRPVIATAAIRWHPLSS